MVRHSGPRQCGDECDHCAAGNDFGHNRPAPVIRRHHGTVKIAAGIMIIVPARDPDRRRAALDTAIATEAPKTMTTAFWRTSPGAGSRRQAATNSAMAAGIVSSIAWAK